MGIKQKSKNNSKALDRISSDTIRSDFPQLGSYKFRFRLQQSVRLPRYAGSAWRGLLGHGLKKAVCVLPGVECASCALAKECAHAFLFESLAITERARSRSSHISPPYVMQIGLDERRDFAAGENIDLQLNLIGRANQLLPYLIHGFNRAGCLGLGHEKSKFEVDSVMYRSPGESRWTMLFTEGQLQSSLPEPGPLSSPVEGVQVIELTTPLRLKRKGHLVTPKTFETRHFFGPLARRIAEIGEHYGMEHHSWSWYDIMQARPLPEAVEFRLRWYDWTRFSSRQKGAMQLGGLVGTLRFAPGALDPWLDLLWLGQWLHLGKSTSFGLGAYKLINGNIVTPATVGE